MKFKEFYALALREDIDFFMYINGSQMPAIITPIHIGEYGEKVFSKLLQAETELTIPPPVEGTIITIKINQPGLEKLGVFFSKGTAGFLDEKVHERLFPKMEEYPMTRVVAEKIFYTLLSLGGYRYTVQKDGYAHDVIYAWNDNDAMEQADFTPESKKGGKQ